MTPTYLLYEPANFHGGDISRLTALIDSLGRLPYTNRGIKFHPIAADTLALPDFSFYSVYQALQFSDEQWAGAIARARDAIGSVWLESADLNCIRVLRDNIDKIDGIKLQTSVLENHEVFSALEELDLSSKIVMLNISGFELGEIGRFVERFRLLRPRQFALQMGFQAYPTAIEDTLLNKIPVLRAAFPSIRLAFADHVDATDPYARTVPLLAALLGCSIIEKHVCLDRRTTRYDQSAALEPVEIEELSRQLALMTRSFSSRFIVPAEAAYLQKTMQRPVTRRGLEKGQLIAPADLFFRRTDSGGLSMAEVETFQQSFHILSRPLEPHRTVTAGDFRHAHIAAIVAGRMKSTRLARKAVLPVSGTPSVVRTLQNCLRFPYVHSVILATSTHPDDAELENYTLGGKVGFWRGEPDDVVKRYLGACAANGIDVVVRVTADCLTMSPEVTKILLEEHFASGADYTRVRQEVPGSAPQIFNVAALSRIDRLSGGAIYSEYMNQYVENNPEHFKIHWVDLPQDLLGPYRLTLDYPEDLQMYEALYKELDRRGEPADLRNIISILRENPEIADLNANVGMVYLQDQSLREKLMRVTRFPGGA